MSAPVHVIEAAFDAAWDRFELASAKLATLEPQADLFDTTNAEAREWLGIVRACEKALPNG